MLSKNQVVKARKAIERLYDDRCTVFVREQYKKANKSTGFREVAKIKDMPCRLSFQASPNAESSDTASFAPQTIKLFFSPDAIIEPGSKLSVTRQGTTTDYEESGRVAKYSTHQEIELRLFKEWT